MSTTMNMQQTDFSASFSHAHTGMNAPRYVEVFLIYTELNQRQKKIELHTWLQDKFDNVDNQLAGQTVFLSQEIALQYSRFTGDNHCILKAYVLDAAIEGCGHGLVLKRGFITKAHVEGYYLNQNNKTSYFKNPFFNESYREYCYL